MWLGMPANSISSLFPLFYVGLMWWSHLGWALGLFAVLDWKRPSTGQLAITEAELLRGEIAQLRVLVQQLEGGCSACDWELCLWRWIAKGLGLVVVCIVLVLLAPKLKAPKISLSLPALEFSPSAGASESSQSPTSVASTGTTLRTGPQRPSDRKRLNNGSDSGHSRGASVGVLSQ